MMRIIIVRKDSLALIPPLLSVANLLSDLGHHVHIITSCVSEPIRSNLQCKKITWQEIDFTGNRSLLGKIIQYFRFRFEVKRALTHLDFDLLWVEDAHTMLSLGRCIKKYKYVLQISELYNTDRRLMEAISKVIESAEVVFMPEYDRSVMYQIWFKLKKRPIVLPNKPYFIPTKSEMEKLRSKYSVYLRQISCKKVILYQGAIMRGRNIGNFIKAAALLGKDFIFVVMGKDENGMVEEYRKLNPNILHINFIPAPDYLIVTSFASIGVLSYEATSLNNAYCAPNKIFEYGAFGVPMVGNDIPGLKVLENNHFGLVVDENNVDAIVHAYKKIDAEYKSYSLNSRTFYDSVDNMQIIRKALDPINRKFY
jgi:glycosyltransferase involved in cell wall biosynthesis